jgi:hypothetical protein
MAAPSLGYAMGLNVETKDIFGKLGPQLGQNLANWSAKKERAAKEKEAKEEKYQQELYELSKEDYHIRVRGEAKKAYDDLRKKVNAMIESGEDSRKIMDTFIEYGDIVRGVRQKSKQLYDDQKAFVQNTNYIHPQVLDVIYNSDTPLNAEQVMEATIFGINSPDPQENNWLTVLAPKMPIVESVGKMKLSEDQAIVELSNQAAAKKKYDADIAAKKKAGDKGPFPPFEQTYTSTSYKSQAIPGYTAPAGAVLTPGETFFIANVANTMLADEANVENALVEYQSKLPKGETLVSKIRAEMQLDPNLTLDQAKFNVARKYVVDNYYDSWASQNSKFMEYNKNTPIPRSGPTSGKQEPKSQVGEMQMLTNTGFNKASELGYSPDDALARSDFQSGQNYLGSGLGVMVETKTTEPFSITVDGQLTQVNPYALFYNRDDGKYYMQYQIAASTAGIGVPLGNFKVTKMGERDIKSLQANKNYQDAMNDLINVVNNKGGSSGGAGRTNIPGF